MYLWRLRVGEAAAGWENFSTSTKGWMTWKRQASQLPQQDPLLDMERGCWGIWAAGVREPSLSVVKRRWWLSDFWSWDIPQPDWRRWTNGGNSIAVHHSEIKDFTSQQLTRYLTMLAEVGAGLGLIGRSAVNDASGSVLKQSLIGISSRLCLLTHSEVVLEEGSYWRQNAM